MADLTQLTDEQREQMRRSMANVQAAFQEFAKALRAALSVTADQFVLHTEALKQAGLLDEDGKPVQPADRPAWQSPYGPPSRRH
ncbi:hypothetical protein [Streptomyces scabiei]|uniref:hypothetical protein n=1 Tax=Streptomyces scabiei TaxID=1930 RepID=UPI00076598E9|nr:hypothetical protein [Streptomyces scabiei]